MRRITVSIIIVNWNGRKWLKKCLDSLRVQTCKDFEIVLVDNSSTDDSVSFVRDNYPEVVIFHSENKGFGYSCNLGAQKAKGRFLMFFNEDMYVDKDFVERYLEEYEKIEDKDNIGTIGCAVADYDRSKVISEKAYGFTVDLMAAPVFNFDKERIFHNTGCPLFISKDLFLKIGGFCENIFLYGEDIDICWRLSLYGYQHYFFQNVYIYHNCAAGSFSKKKLALYIKGEINCIFNNYSLLFLPIALTYFLSFYFFLSLVYLVLGRATFLRTIYEAFWSELRYNFRNIMSFRKIVQSGRKVSDWSLLRRMNVMPSRLSNLTYVRNYKEYADKSYLSRVLLKKGKINGE